MAISELRVPPGPTEQFGANDDLFRWIHENYIRYGGIYKASIFGHEVYVVSAPEYCERILRYDWQNYPRGGLVVKRIALALGNNLITSNDADWANQRRMIQPAFTKSTIAALATVIASVNIDLLEKWKRAARRRDTINVTQDVSFMILKITLISIFGDDYEIAAPHFTFFAEESARNFRFAQELSPLRELILQIVAQRRRESRTSTDTLGRLMQARDRERGELMPDAQLAREILNLVVAGHETTASLLNWMWYLLARHPEVQIALAAEFDQFPWQDSPAMESLAKYTYTRQVIDEALRLYPPLWLMTRKALKDSQLGDFFVPAGTEIYISPYLIQRSPQLWEAPDDFDPDRMSVHNGLDRHELALCPFGAGPRNCIGEVFARVEIQLHLMIFAKELWLRFDETKPPEISTTGLNLLSKHDFIMRPEIKTMALT